MADSKNVASSLTELVKQLVLDEFKTKGDDILNYDTEDIAADVVAEIAKLTSDDSAMDLAEHVAELLTTKAPEEPTCDHPQLYAYLAVNFCVPVAHSSAQEMEMVHVKVTEAIEKGINTHPQVKYYLSDKIEICEYPNEYT